MSDHHRIENGSKFKLSGIDPADTGKFSSRAEAETRLAKDVKLLSELHDKLYVWTVALPR